MSIMERNQHRNFFILPLSAAASFFHLYSVYMERRDEGAAPYILFGTFV